jgi:hypothetical protein
MIAQKSKRKHKVALLLFSAVFAALGTGLVYAQDRESRLRCRDSRGRHHRKCGRAQIKITSLPFPFLSVHRRRRSVRGGNPREKGRAERFSLSSSALA